MCIYGASTINMSVIQHESVLKQCLVSDPRFYVLIQSNLEIRNIYSEQPGISDYFLLTEKETKGDSANWR